MNEASVPLDILQEFLGVVDKLSECGIEYAVCGGFAVNIHGHVRATRDMDILLQATDVERVRAAVREIGYSNCAGPIPFSAGTELERRLFRITKFSGRDFRHGSNRGNSLRPLRGSKMGT